MREGTDRTVTISPGFLPWIALAAVLVGTVGVIRGLTARRRPRRHAWMATGGSEDVTPPHGDVLQPLV